MLSTFVSVSKENKIDRENTISFIIMYVFIIYSFFFSLFIFIHGMYKVPIHTPYQ